MRNNALQGYVIAIGREDPEGAGNFALILTDADQRARVMPRLIYEWVRRDMDGAMAFLSNLPNDGTKNEIISNSMWGLRAMIRARLSICGGKYDGARAG